MPRMPRWSVTWPTRPRGLYTVLVHAVDPAAAVRVAAQQEMPLNDGYSLAFDYEPQVWRLLRPYRLRSYPAAGPDYPDAVPGEVAFTPLPLDLRAVADQVESAIRVSDAHGRSEAEVRAAVGQVVAGLAPAEMQMVLALVAADTAEINSR